VTILLTCRLGTLVRGQFALPAAEAILLGTVAIAVLVLRRALCRPGVYAELVRRASWSSGLKSA
jgi:hypothetical protein